MLTSANELSGYGEITIGGKDLPFGFGKIGGRPLPFKFGANAYRLYCEYKKIDLPQMYATFQTDPFALVELAYFAYVTAMRLRDEPTEVGLDTFIELVGDEKGVIEKFNEIIKTSRMWGVTIEEAKAKKKS